jgi:hypothetical protein
VTVAEVVDVISKQERELEELFKGAVLGTRNLQMTTELRSEGTASDGKD